MKGCSFGALIALLLSQLLVSVDCFTHSKKAHWSFNWVLMPALLTKADMSPLVLPLCVGPMKIFY